MKIELIEEEIRFLDQLTFHPSQLEDEVKMVTNRIKELRDLLGKEDEHGK